MKCPICSTPMVTKDYYDGAYLVEEFARCDDGCKLYGSEWAYGCGRELIGFKEIYNHHNDSKATRRKRSFIRKEILKRERKAYKKSQKE